MTRMFNLKINEVTLCNRGHNNKEYILRKHKGGIRMNEDLLKAVKKAEFDNEAEVIVILEKCTNDAEAKVLLDSMVALKTAKLPEGSLPAVLKASGHEITLSEEKINELVAKALAEKEAAKFAEEEAVRKAKAGEIDLSEIHNPATVAALNILMKAQKGSTEVIKSLTKRAETAEAKIKKSETDAVLKAAIEKTAVFKNIAIPPEQTGEILAKMSPKDVLKFEAILKSVDSIAKKAGETIFDEIGSGRPGVSGGVFEKVTKMAQEKVTKSTVGQTIEEARAEIWEARPDLFDAYQAENPVIAQAE